MGIRAHIHVAVLVLVLVSSGLAAATAVFAADADAPVLAQDLTKVRASGKVLAALWTARPDSYTLQLVMPVVPALPPAPQAARISTDQPRTPQPPTVQVWLLKADGTVILPSSEVIPPLSRRYACGRCVSYELAYSFAHAMGREAVAAAIRINDDYYVEALKPLRDH